MNHVVTSIQVRGCASAAMILTGFGGLWLGLPLYSLGWLHASALLALAAGAVLLGLRAVQLFRAAKRLPEAAGDPAVRRRFSQVNAAQWILISIAALLFHYFGLDNYITNLITGVVGLHMLPLARIFRYWPHYAIGAALIAWAVASLFPVPAASLQAVDAWGTGGILWLSAAAMLALHLPAVRKAALAAG